MNKNKFNKTYNTHPIDIKNINNLSYYLAGLIEGNGNISFNKDNLSISISFHTKDKPLAQRLKILIGQGFGYIAYIKYNFIELVFKEKDSLIFILNLINGKFRTPKYYQLVKAINFSNKNFSSQIFIKPIDKSSIKTNSWLAGFIEADGHFYIRHSDEQIICKFSLEQRMIYPTRLYEYFNILNINNFKFDYNFNYLDSYNVDFRNDETNSLINFKSNMQNSHFLNDICSAFNVNLKDRSRKIQDHLYKPYYIIRIENQASIKLLIDYLDIYPLFSSKYLDFLNWKLAFFLILAKEHYNDIGSYHIKSLKDSMNNSRTVFKWDHLNNI